MAARSKNDSVISTRRPGARTFIFRALSHRNYQLFFAGQSISLIGTWMTRIATNWLVYRLTGSALLLGVVGFAGQIPSFVLAPFAGVLVDRWSRHRLLVVTQGARPRAIARKSVLGLGKYIPLTAAAFGAGMIVFSFTRVSWPALLLMVATQITTNHTKRGASFLVRDFVFSRKISTNHAKRGASFFV